MKRFILIVMSLLIIIFSGCYFPHASLLKVSFINVGEGDSILIQYKGRNFLIDGGPLQNSDDLIRYMKVEHIKKFDSIFITHPHEDHIGGISKVLSKYKTENIFSSQGISNSPGFIKLTNIIKEKKLKNIILTNGEKIVVDKNLYFHILSPNKGTYDNTNNYSLVIKMTYMNNSFLFMGDAEKEIEDAIAESNINLKSDVIKIAHHGSTTSSTEKLLDSVSAKIAIISCGINNQFNHPSKVILERLKKRNILFFRTDIDGTVELYSDGNTIKKD